MTQKHECLWIREGWLMWTKCGHSASVDHTLSFCGYCGGKLRVVGPVEPLPPAPYTAEELDRDNPYNQWMHET